MTLHCCVANVTNVSDRICTQIQLLVWQLGLDLCLFEFSHPARAQKNKNAKRLNLTTTALHTAFITHHTMITPSHHHTTHHSYHTHHVTSLLTSVSCLSPCSGSVYCRSSYMCLSTGCKNTSSKQAPSVSIMCFQIFSGCKSWSCWLSRTKFFKWLKPVADPALPWNCKWIFQWQHCCSIHLSTKFLRNLKVKCVTLQN